MLINLFLTFILLSYLISYHALFRRESLLIEGGLTPTHWIIGLTQYTKGMLIGVYHCTIVVLMSDDKLIGAIKEIEAKQKQEEELDAKDNVE